MLAAEPGPDIFLWTPPPNFSPVLFLQLNWSQQLGRHWTAPPSETRDTTDQTQRSKLTR